MLLAIDFTNLHEILQVLYQDMMPLCEKLTGVAKGIAGLGALFYVAAKVWQALARAEPIDVYPLLRPFAIGLVADISEIYVRNYQKMLGDPNYTPDELSTISFGYAKLLSESADILQDLKNVVNVTGMSLSDAERLAIIDQSYKRLLEYRNLVQYYTDKNISVSYLRAKKKKDADRVVALYGDAEDRYW